MALPRRKLDVIFAPGALNAAVDPRTAVAGTMVEAQNVTRTRANEWRKRSGTTQLSNSPLLNAVTDLKKVWQVAGWKDGLVSLSKHTAGGIFPVFVYSPEADRWGTPVEATRSYNPGPVASRRFSLGGDAGTTSKVPDLAVSPNADYAISAWEVYNSAGTSIGIMEALVDTTTEKVINTSFLSDAERPRCEAVGNYLLLIYWRPVVGSFAIRQWNVTTITSGTVTAVDNSVATNVVDRFDTIIHNSKLSIAAFDGTALVYILEYTPSSGAVTTATSFACVAGDAADPAIGAIGWLRDFGGSGKRILGTIGAGVGVGLQVHIIATAGTVDVTYTMDTAAATRAQGRNITGYTNSSSATGTFVVIYELREASGGASVLTTLIKVAQRQNTDLVPSSQWLGGVGLVGKAFTQDGGYYVMVANPYNNLSTQPTHFLMRVDVGAASGSVG